MQNNVSSEHYLYAIVTHVTEICYYFAGGKKTSGIKILECLAGGGTGDIFYLCSST